MGLESDSELEKLEDLKLGPCQHARHQNGTKNDDEEDPEEGF